MTRTTLKALWFGGAGLLATWLAVPPDTGPLPASRTHDQHTTAHSEQKASQLIAEAVELRERTDAVTMRPPTRNPFRFSSRKSDVRPVPVRDVQATDLPAAPAAPSLPPLSLAGIAQDAGKRTAVLTSGSQMYLVVEGESVARALTVIRIDADSVLLRDSSGAELQLQLSR